MIWVKRITHRRDQNGKNILFRTNQGDYTTVQIASKINSGEDTFVENTSTRVHVVKDDPRYIRSNSNNRNNDDLDPEKVKPRIKLILKKVS